MKKYKIVGLPKMHNGGIGAGHPHEKKKLKKNRNNAFTRIKNRFTLSDSGPTGSLIAPDDPIKEKKLSRKQHKELGDMSYDEMVSYVNEQNDMFKELNLPAQYIMPDLSKVYGKKELQGLSREERKAYKNMSFYDQIKFRTEKIRSDDFYDVDDISTQEIVDPISTTTDIKPHRYGDDHYNSQRSIYDSFDIIEKEYVLPKYEKREDGSWFKVRDEISRYDLEVEELKKKYETIEAQMRASFGDREGDPTHAEDWQNRDGKLYRKQLNALGSELQNLLLKRREQAGENVGVQKWTRDENGFPRLSNQPFTRTPNNDYEFNKQTIKEMGYIPKNYLLDFDNVVVYPKKSDLQEALQNNKLTLDERNAYEQSIKDDKNGKQQQLNKQAELLWTLGAIEGYIPDKKVPIGGTIKDLEEFISGYETDIADFKKQRTASNTQLKDYAAYIGVKNFDPKEGNLASEANYKLLRKAMAKNPSDQHLMKIYKDIFMEDFDPNAVQLNPEQMDAMIDAGWGDGSMDAIYDLAKVVAYGAPAAPFVVSGLVTLMNNPLFTLLMDGYFAYETPQMVEDFYKNAKKVIETTDPGTWDRLGGTFGIGIDALFVQLGITGGKRIVRGAKEVRKTLTGAPKSEAELSQLLREQLSAKGNLSTKQYKQRMQNSNFRKEEELIENASLKELQARSARKGIVYDEYGNTILQFDKPYYLNYTKKGTPGVQLTDASGKVISNTGKGDVIIGMGKTEIVSVPSVGNIPKVVKPYIKQQIPLPGGATIEIGVYKFDGAAEAMGKAAVARGTGAATEATGEANFEIARADRVGLGEQYGADAIVIAFNDGVKISAENLEKLAKEVDVVIAKGQVIVLNQKAVTKSPRIVDPEGLNKFNITEKDILDAANRIRERLLSPKFIKNNAAATGRTEEEVIESINKMVSEFESGKVTFSNNPASEYGAVYNGKGKIDINVGNLGNRDQALGALDHEINHVFSDVGKPGTVIPPKVVIGPDGKKEVVLGSTLYDTYPTVKVVGDNYFNAPHEQQVRARRAMQWLEDNAGLKMGEEITTPMVEKLGEAIKNGETSFAETNTGGKWTAPPSEGGTFEYQYKKGDYMGGVDGGRSMSGEYYDLRGMFSNLDIKSVLTESEMSLLDKIPTGSKKWNETVKDLLNKAYQAALPLIGGAGAAMLSDSDEDMDGAMIAALPLMIFGRGKKINLKNAYKNIRDFFKTVPALKNVLFKQSELESYVLKNLPAKITKELGPNLTFEKLVEVKPEVVKNAVVDYVAETLPSSADLDPATTMSYDKGYVTESFMKEDYGKNSLKSKPVGTTFKELAPNGSVTKIAKDGMVSTEEALAIINKGSMPHLKVPRIKAELANRYGEDIPEKISLDELNDIANLVIVPLNITVSGQITKENGIVYDKVLFKPIGSTEAYGNPTYGHMRIGFDKAPIDSKILNTFTGLNAEEAAVKFNQINEEFAKEVKSSRDKYAALEKEQDDQVDVIRDALKMVDEKSLWLDLNITKEQWYSQALQNPSGMDEVNAFSEAQKNLNLANKKYERLTMEMTSLGKRADYKKRQHDELADSLDDFVNGIIPEFTVNNRTLIFSNNARLPGYGVAKHDTPEGTMGHVYITEKNSEPGTLYATQIQSDAAQRPTYEQFSKKGIEKLYVDEEWHNMDIAIVNKIDEIKVNDPRVGKIRRDEMYWMWQKVRKGITNGNSYDTYAKEIAKLERYLGESLFATESKSMGRTKVDDVLLADRLGPNDNTLKDAKAYQKDSRIRMIEETIYWAAQNGYTKVRFPAPQTVVNIQQYDSYLNFSTPKEGLGNNIANVYETNFIDATLANYLDFSKTKAAFNTKADDKDIIRTLLTDDEKIKLLYKMHLTNLYDVRKHSDVAEPIVDLVDNAGLAEKIVESGKPLWEYVQKTDSSGKPIKGKELKSDFYNNDQIEAIKKLLQRGERQLKHVLESQVNGTDPFRNVDKFNMLPDDKYKIVMQHKKDYEEVQKRFPNVKFLTEKPIVGSKGNYWYEFVMPKEIMDGERPIISYKKGGQVKRKLKIPNPQFEELELTEKEALAYAQKGYIVEEIS